jgi:hypothetical protein
MYANRLKTPMIIIAMTAMKRIARSGLAVKLTKPRTPPVISDMTPTTVLFWKTGVAGASVLQDFKYELHP